MPPIKTMDTQFDDHYHIVVILQRIASERVNGPYAMKQFQMMHTSTGSARERCLGSIRKNSCQVVVKALVYGSKRKQKLSLSRIMKIKDKSKCLISQ